MVTYAETAHNVKISKLGNEWIVELLIELKSTNIGVIMMSNFLNSTLGHTYPYLY